MPYRYYHFLQKNLEKEKLALHLDRWDFVLFSCTYAGEYSLT